MATILLGLSALGHDPAACIFVDGKLRAAVEEERLNRHKNTLEFPYEAIRFVLKHVGVAFEDVDRIAFYWDDNGQLLKGLGRAARVGAAHPLGALRLFRQRLRSRLGPSLLRDKLAQLVGGDRAKVPPIVFVPHHEAHMAAAWLSAPFAPDCALIIDGRGEYAATSLYLLRDRALSGNGGNGHRPAGHRPALIDDFAFPNSLGVFYGAITQRLGYRAISDEYKVMGLASYGEPDEFWRRRVSELLDITPDGSYRLDPRFFHPERCSSNEQSWLNDFGEHHLSGELRTDQGFTAAGQSLARATQSRLEEAIVGLTRRLVARGGRRMVLSGGVAMNSRAVGQLRAAGLLEALHVPLAPYDAGASIGAALSVLWRDPAAAIDSDHLTMPFLGPGYEDAQIELTLAKSRSKCDRPADLARAAAEDLANGRIIGWFDGRMEFGARALGARSILGDPRDAATRDRINRYVKRRENYRPFAPAVLEEQAPRYFDTVQNRLMTEVVRALPIAAKTVPAVVHVDGTARPQTVPHHWPVPSFRALIEAFHQLTGVPMIVNTSFNVRDEPIVASPDDALRCFAESGLDRLYIGPFRVEQKHNVSQ